MSAKMKITINIIDLINLARFDYTYLFIRNIYLISGGNHRNCRFPLLIVYHFFREH